MTVEAEGLCVRFERRFGRQAVTALDQVDLRIADGEFFALLGLNGAGKSTAMACFLGLLRPTSGAVRLFGSRPVPGSGVYRYVGFLPEEPHYHEYLTVEEALVYYGRLTGNSTWRSDATRLMERLGLGEFRKRRLARCSKGVKQKVGIVQCLLGRPRLLFVDEPMRGLDPLAVREFRDLLLEANNQGATIVMNSHILSEVEMVASRVAVLHHGRVVADGRLSDIIPCTSDAYVVEVERCDALPSYFRVDSGQAGTVSGLLPTERFDDFIDFARSRRLRIVSCALKRRTLEDAFVALIRPSDA